ncbi:MAG: type I-E CRISPR-associated protein Cas5/CasD, partial [Pseudomonadota bacterium]
MSEHLVFTLTAALGAMGDLAGHERRGSWGWPGRSALVGLLGAAQGIRRDGDFSALERLRYAVAIFDEGGALRDYHTVETVPSAKAKSPQTRREALRLARGRTNTMITIRDYRTSPLFGVAVWGGTLGPLCDALANPVFPLYLGRKSCPLAAPTGAQIVAAEDPAIALGHVILPPWRTGAVAQLLASDDGPWDRVEQRHDRAIDRMRWH